MADENIPDKFQLQKGDDNTFDYEFNDDEIKILDQRRQDRLTGKSDTYYWEEAKALITGKKQI